MYGGLPNTCAPLLKALDAQPIRYLAITTSLAVKVPDVGMSSWPDLFPGKGLIDARSAVRPSASEFAVTFAIKEERRRFSVLKGRFFSF
jgi:hypothetical protein